MVNLSCLWIQESLDKISTDCIRSWIKVGYTVDLYTYSDTFTHNLGECLNVLNANEVLPWTEGQYEHVADLFRFTLFKNNKGKRIIWLDTDQFLFRRFPTDKNFVSSQKTPQSGAFKLEKKKIANIGVMSFDGTEKIDWAKIMNAGGKHTTFQSKYLKRYEREISKYDELILDPDAFCPVSYQWAKDLYTETMFQKQKKFDIYQAQMDDIKNEEHIYGVHLWRQIFRKKNFNIENKSIYNEIINS